MSYSRPKSPTTHRHVRPRARLTAVALAGGVVAATAALTAGSATAFANPITPWFHNGPNQSTVYTETNQVGGNTVLAYPGQLRRWADATRIGSDRWDGHRKEPGVPGRSHPRRQRAGSCGCQRRVEQCQCLFRRSVGISAVDRNGELGVVSIRSV